MDTKYWASPSHIYSPVIVSFQHVLLQSEVLEMAQPEPSPNASDGLPARLTGPWVHDKNKPSGGK
jgi:hypothetical protein